MTVQHTYKGLDRKLETQMALWSEVAQDAWGMKGKGGGFLFFWGDILPKLIEELTNLL